MIIKHVVNLTLDDTLLKVVSWHKKNGGGVINENLAPHALRLLNEVVELCLACGAKPWEIQYTAAEEIKKQLARGIEMSMDVGDEIADVQILTAILAYYARKNLREECEHKLDILHTRKWKADEHGVLWRDKT